MLIGTVSKEGHGIQKNQRNFRGKNMVSSNKCDFFDSWVFQHSLLNN